jgi:hypothetical protein
MTRDAETTPSTTTSPNSVTSSPPSEAALETEQGIEIEPLGDQERKVSR